ncbi:MAG: glycoside hydrolase family 15 protein [Thermoplasmata archaeon]|nr:glycoside hydrolase family 15 protein [Thermoplasmata archaeon]
MEFRGDREAFGGPGIDPKWTHGNKDGVGTAFSADCKLWFTVWRGVVTEVYYPLVDRPQLRDLQFLVSDGTTFFHDEKRQLHTRTERTAGPGLGYRITNSDPDGRYTIHKEVIADPHLPVLLQHLRLETKSKFPNPLALYVLAAPHLDGTGWGNNAYVGRLAGREILLAEKNGTWLALGANVPFSQLSCGFVGASDGWTDISSHLGMTWEFDRATDGNVALTAALDLGDRTEFTLGLAFGRGRQHAVAALLQSLSTPYETHRVRFGQQWGRAAAHLRPFAHRSARLHDLQQGSYCLLLAHEDKTFPGAFVASLSIPWGYAKGDKDRGGYHLVWTRDLVQIAGGLLAAGDQTTPLRTLIYIAASQLPDGSFPQNFWVDGTAYWGGLQLDEVAFPILLADKLRRENALAEFDPYPMVQRAARFLVENGPATQQERWEEASGYSPSTLAVTIAACVVAAEFASERADPATSEFLLSYADFLEGHLERWTVTEHGTLDPRVPRHYVRIHPVAMGDTTPNENPDEGVLLLANQAPGAPTGFPAREVVDAGFLELVRHGVRRADDPTIVASVQLVDRILRVETPEGPCWHRYNHDGYGQRDDGGPFDEWGRGRAWPLLTGERAHYELAAGRSAGPLLEAMARFASPTGLLSEQVWDTTSVPVQHLTPGKPTGAAMPLAWAHAEFLKLLRSAEDGEVFDRIPTVEARYLPKDPGRVAWEFWKPNRRPPTVRATERLRLVAPEPFRLRWTSDAWGRVEETTSSSTGLGVEFVDLPTPAPLGTVFEFTFYWTQRDAWEGSNSTVVVV